MIYSRPTQLRTALEQKVQKAMSIMVEEIYKSLMFFIDADIYESYSPAEYERTYEFRNKAWDKKIHRDAQKIVGEIFYDGMNMTYNPAKYQHGSKTEDRRARLAEILNNSEDDEEAYASDWDMGRNPMPSAYWDHTLAWLDYKWDDLVRDAMNKVGIKIK